MLLIREFLEALQQALGLGISSAARTIKITTTTSASTKVIPSRRLTDLLLFMSNNQSISDAIAYTVDFTP